MMEHSRAGTPEQLSETCGYREGCYHVRRREIDEGASMKSYIAAAAVASLLAGCAAQNVKSDYSLAQAKADGKGLLVFSLTTDDPNSPYIPSLIFAFGDEPRGDDEGRPIEGLKGCSSTASEFKDGC